MLYYLRNIVCLRGKNYWDKIVREMRKQRNYISKRGKTMAGTETFLTLEEKVKHTPSNGRWTGVRGNSRFYSNNDTVKAMGAEYVDYINGEPDFSRFSVITLEIPSMSEDRAYSKSDYLSNFQQVYEVLSNRLNMRKKDVKNWLKENHYTIHECMDLKTIQIIPIEIHQTYIHVGGVAECKEIYNDDIDDDDILMIDSLF